LGVCYNNMANVLRAQGKPPEARDLYYKAISIAESRLDKATDPKEKMSEAVTLGNRLMNLGVLVQDGVTKTSADDVLLRADHKVRDGERKDLDEAKGYFERALSMMRNADDSIGIAKVSGNLSLMYMYQGDWRTAETLLQDATAIIAKSNDLLCMQYLIVNQGILNLHKGWARKLSG
jgi:tetratricopeptide (TPR) repeat protein